MKRFLFAATVAFTLLACTPTTETLPKEGLVISEAVVRTPLGGQTMTAGYFQITNYSDTDDALIGVQSPISERIEIHQTENIDGKMRMRKQVSIDLKAGETVHFKPGGLHLMMFDVKTAQDQTDAALTLKFKLADDLTVIADITDTVSLSGHH